MNERRESRPERDAGDDGQGGNRPASEERHPLFLPVVLFSGAVFGFGLGVSRMARPEVVLDFLQFEDFGLLFVMGGAAAVTAVVFTVGVSLNRTAPLTDRAYGRREKTFDRNVLAGGAIFGVGWGLSGICPGAAYASLGVGNVPILWGVAGMFLGAYAQGYLRRALSGENAATTAGAD